MVFRNYDLLYIYWGVAVVVAVTVIASWVEKGHVSLAVVDGRWRQGEGDNGEGDGYCGETVERVINVQ